MAAPKNTLTQEELDRLKAEFYARGGVTTQLKTYNVPRHVKRGFGVVDHAT